MLMFRFRDMGKSPLCDPKNPTNSCIVMELDASMGLSSGKLPIPSNVTRISQAIKPVSSTGIEQVLPYYYPTDCLY